MKQVILSAAVILAVSASGCSRNAIALSRAEPETVTVQSTTVETTAVTENPKYKERQEKLQYASDIREEYQNIAKANTLSFTMSDRIEKFMGFYMVEIRVDDVRRSDITFSQRRDGIMGKSFHSIFYENQVDSGVIRDFITATAMVMDDKMSLEEAGKLADQLNEALELYDISDTVYLGEYGLYLEKGRRVVEAASRDPIKINAIHKDEVNIPVNKEDYEEYDYEGLKRASKEKPETYFRRIFKKSQDELKNVYLTGVVINKEQTDYSNLLYVKGENGVECTVTYQYVDFLKDFELNKAYTFYGVCFAEPSDEPFITAEYYEEYH